MDGDEDSRRKAGVNDVHLYTQLVEYMFRRAVWQAERITKPTNHGHNAQKRKRTHTPRISSNIKLDRYSYETSSSSSSSSLPRNTSLMSPRVSIKSLNQFNFPRESNMSFNLSRDMFRELTKLQQEGSYELAPNLYGDMIAAYLTAGHYLQRPSYWNEALQLAKEMFESGMTPDHTLLQKMVQLCPAVHLPVGPVKVLSLLQAPRAYTFNLVLKALNNAGYHQDAVVLWEALLTMQGRDGYFKAMDDTSANEESRRGIESEERASLRRRWEEHEAPVELSTTNLPSEHLRAVLDPSRTLRMIGASGSGCESIRPDKYTISTVVNAYTRSNRPHDAYATVTTYWKEFEKEVGSASRAGHSTSTDLALLNSALYACAEMGNTGLMEDIIARIAALGSTPDSYTMFALLLAMCKDGREREAFRMLLEWRRFADEQDDEDREAQGREARLAGMKGTRNGGRPAAATASSGRRRSQRPPKPHNDSRSRPLARCYNVILHACQLTRNLDFANEVINTMDRTGVVPNDATFRLVLNMFGDSLVWKGLFGGRLALTYEKIKMDAEKNSQSPKWNRELEDARTAWESERELDRKGSVELGKRSTRKQPKMKIDTWGAAEERRRKKMENTSGTMHPAIDQALSAQSREQRDQEYARLPIKEAKDAEKMSVPASVYLDPQEAAQSLETSNSTDGRLGGRGAGDGHGRILDVRRRSEMEVKLLLKDSVEALIEETSPSTTALRNIDVLILTGFGNPQRSARRVLNTMGIEPMVINGNAGRLFLAGEEIEAFAIREANKVSIDDLRRSLMFRGSLLATMVLGPLFVAPSVMGVLNSAWG